MNDRRALRRYMSLVHRAEEVLDASLEGPQTPPPAEAVVALDGLVGALAPALARMPDHAPDLADTRRLLAGWVH